MNEAKFSKGEWVLVDDIDEHFWYIDILNEKRHDHRAIAEIVVKMADDSSDGEGYDEELKANAFLMSKANKMYEMLSDISKSNCRCDEFYEEIVKLLAEARGETK